MEGLKFRIVLTILSFFFRRQLVCVDSFGTSRVLSQTSFTSFSQSCLFTSKVWRWLSGRGSAHASKQASKIYGLRLQQGSFCSFESVRAACNICNETIKLHLLVIFLYSMCTPRLRASITPLPFKAMISLQKKHSQPSASLCPYFVLSLLIQSLPSYLQCKSPSQIDCVLSKKAIRLSVPISPLRDWC